MRTEYVVGFLFDDSMEGVALIQKIKPDWQKGFWNGIGGRVEERETPLNAVKREFREEAGVSISRWIRYATLEVENKDIIFFVAKSNKIRGIRSAEKEKVRVFQTKNLPTNILPNLLWLIPLAVDVALGNIESLLAHIKELTKGCLKNEEQS